MHYARIACGGIPAKGRLKCCLEIVTRENRNGSPLFSLSKNCVFDRLTEVKGAAETSKPDPSAYWWYVRVRFVR